MASKKEVLVVYGDRRRSIVFEPSQNPKEERLKIIDGDCKNPSEEGYLTSLIGNMGTNDLQNFLRFTTGSSVCIADK